MNAKLRLGAGAAWVVLVALLAADRGCTVNRSETGTYGSSVAPSDTGGDTSWDTADESGGSPEDSAGDETALPADDGTDTADSGGDTDTSDGTTSDGNDTQSGTLTAGSFDDNLNLDVFQDFLTEVLQSDTAGDFPNLVLGQRIIVTVEDEQGAPVMDARVVIAAEGQEDTPLLDQVTGSDGRVLFLTALDGAAEAASFTLTVYPAADAEPVSEVRDLKDLEWHVTVAAPAAPPGQLDLAFVIDTTGSMTDELEYLKAEVGSIARAVAEVFPDVKQRYALIAYRDQGDIYVVRTFDFTPSLDEFVDNLMAQSADAGGDWPEAVHQALEAAQRLSWTATGTARVLFWIADAPPHTEFAERTLNAIQAFRAATIGVYPVAASGVGTELEFFMRSAACLTLSEYLFLTNDSGIGNPHAEPHIPCYQVQRLDQLMIRMIKAELTGARVEPDPADVIRTVGNPVAGVCTEQDNSGQQQDGQAP
jgi:hypothetical protein